ncbi:MAG TPA: acyl-[ACP]--phospholipid O-acyltransferase [Bauldia sp.]|nr:acyl-[ACP]--phospholipid O-acyltransferase [Bauldia sp.]
MLASLMTSRRFAPLFWCQFFAAFNDNFLKNALTFVILFKVASSGSAVLVTLAGAVFIAPFFFLSGLAGQLADRYDKAIIARRLKLTEIGAAAVAVIGFLLQSVPVLFAALLLFGILAALFTPTKYGLLPDHLRTEELPSGNALVEAATFLAILTGTISGGLAAARGVGPLPFVVLVMGFAALSWWAARAIPPTGEAAPHLHVDRNVFRSTGMLVRLIWNDPRIWRGGLMVSWFWTLGAVILALLPVLIKDTLGGGEGVVTVCLAVFSVGIGAGSIAAAWLSGGRILLLPVPIAALAMGLFLLDLGLAASAATPPAAEQGIADFFGNGPGWHYAADFLGIAFFGGIFIVPVFAAVQHWALPEQRARVIGAVNVVSSGAMVLGAIAVAVLQAIGLGAPTIFLILAGASAIVAGLVFRFLPANKVRDFLTLVFRLVYRMQVRGAENIARAGPTAIFALNHVSFLDAGVALSLLEDDPVFAIDHDIAQRWWVRPFLRFGRAIPLDPTKPMATRTLINAVRGGDSLIIFPEGRLTVTGSLMKVYDGAGLVADKAGVMVVPVRIDGLEHSAFTRLTRAQARRRWWPKVTVTLLEPVRLALDPALRGRVRRRAAGAALYEVMSDLIYRTTSIDRTVVEALIEAGRKQGFGRRAVEDPGPSHLSYRRLLAGAATLARKLMPYAGEGEALGVMLPNANGAAVTVLGVMSAGRVAAMINFTAGAANILAACAAARVDTILTSRAFVERAKLEKVVEAVGEKVKFVYLEDVRASVGVVDRLRGLWEAKRPLVRRQPGDIAAILFTSGSEGVPKGVALSHRNLLVNAAQAAARIDFGRSDKLFNVLPVFHAFGLTVGFILPLVSGVRVYFYPSPLHYRVVPELIYASNATILLGTDTFLSGYARSANNYDLRSLRYIVAGAEPVKEATRRVYTEKFGLRILEGYGTTETGPALAFNTPMFNRFGTVGRMLPGIATRIEPVEGIAEGGRLHVSGPNVMIGYLRHTDPGRVESPTNGWYDTGDIVHMDSDGYLAIRGRARRFAKIAGEMVSLAAVEAAASELWPDTPLAVTAVPDDRKGQRLILMTEKADATRGELGFHMRNAGYSELMVPSEIIVAPVPLLGTGKVDNPAVAAFVAAVLASRGAPPRDLPEREAAAPIRAVS